MRVLLALLLVGIAGCGGGSSPPGEGAVPTPEESQAKTDKPPAQTANADPVAALEKIGAKIKRKEQGEVVGVHLYGTRGTDAGLVHLKGLANLQAVNLMASSPAMGNPRLARVLFPIVVSASKNGKSEPPLRIARRFLG